MLTNLRAALALPCKLSWGSDPKIQLDGVAVEIGIEAVIVTVGLCDPRLLPPAGKRVLVEIEWPGAPDSPAKCFACRGVVDSRADLNGSGTRFHCRIRRGRFTDAKPKPVQDGTPNGWMM